ncbi:MAG TPA: protein-glutamate O-methyltransferase CheR [Allocoleopsis sp.]
MSNQRFLSEELRQAFTRLIAKHTGLEIRERDKTALSEKIALRMKALKFDIPETYYQLLSSSTPESYQEWERLAILMTNIESYFFRDRDQFALLRDRILPELIQRKQNNKTIRICSAGCSSGEEPYSLAILLKEIIPDLEQWHLTIVGLDINQEALKKAEKGVYRPWSFRRVDREIVQRYFRLRNDEYNIDSSINQMVIFKALNLVNGVFPLPNSALSEFDLILCRNVFIYFDSPAIERVLNKFYNALQPFGYLITGHAELYGQNLSQFQTKVFPESVVYQRLDKSLIETPMVSLSSEQNYISPENLSSDLNQGDLVSALEKNNIKMQQTALNLLKQLPPETQIPKLGNLTVAELISQLETTLKAMNWETQ